MAASALGANKGRARVASWLMVVSSAWSALVVAQLVSMGRSTLLVDGLVVASEWTLSWAFLGLAMTAFTGSVVAAVLIARGAWTPARPVLALVACTGFLGLFSAGASLACLWIIRRRQ